MMGQASVPQPSCRQKLTSVLGLGPEVAEALWRLPAEGLPRHDGAGGPADLPLPRDHAGLRHRDEGRDPRDVRGRHHERDRFRDRHPEAGGSEGRPRRRHLQRQVPALPAPGKAQPMQDCRRSERPTGSDEQREIRPPAAALRCATALAKVRAAEDAWNARAIPLRVALAYTVDSQWRNRSEFFSGPRRRSSSSSSASGRTRARLPADQGALGPSGADRIAVRFAYEWHDDSGQLVPFAYGNENWEFDPSRSACARRIASINDLPIDASRAQVPLAAGPAPVRPPRSLRARPLIAQRLPGVRWTQPYGASAERRCQGRGRRGRRAQTVLAPKWLGGHPSGSSALRNCARHPRLPRPRDAVLTAQDGPAVASTGGARRTGASISARKRSRRVTLPFRRQASPANVCCFDISNPPTRLYRLGRVVQRLPSRARSAEARCARSSPSRCAASPR